MKRSSLASKMKKTIIIIALMLASNQVQAQDNGTGPEKPIGINEYLAHVAKGNLSYLAGQYNLRIADAALNAARVFNDPEIAVAYTDNQDKILQMGRGLDAGVSYSLNLGNLRGARIGLAKSEKELTALVLQVYFQNLRAEAALVYYNALKEKLLADIQQDNLIRMLELAKADSIRYHAGMIMEVDARQSAIEARMQKNEVIRAEATRRISLIQMDLLRGSVGADSACFPVGSLEYTLRDFSFPWLVEKAMENRLELQEARQNQVLSEKMVSLVKASRAMELGIETGISYSTIATNEIAPSPSHYAFNLGVSIPLKFSSLNHGQLSASHLAVRQQEILYQEARQIILSEVTEAFILYQSQKEQLDEFHSGLLKEAEIILNNKIYSYKRGETSLLDVLNAQRTYNEIRKSFYETHYEYLAALINLERAAGIWDIE
ncbi:MAG: hypothetical protein A2X22_00910 [Bacteroidetes bacterium GWF2_49_14]|nr:MAG: hypothetical protein A2X22_00910 [Bacteroidetes bacterium GWF2_49_14]